MATVKQGATNKATLKHECDGCRGDGIYYGRGYVENGVFKGFQGTCFRCGGKGYQTAADVKRNNYYDNRVRRIRP